MAISIVGTYAIVGMFIGPPLIGLFIARLWVAICLFDLDVLWLNVIYLYHECFFKKLKQD